MTKIQSNLFHSVVLSKPFMFIPLLVIMLVAISITLEEIQFLMNHFAADSVNFIEKREETLAILLIGFGVVMEGREIFSAKVLKQLNDDTFSEHHELNEVCEYYGFILLVIGLLIEIIDQLAAYVHEYLMVAFFLEAGLNLSLNFIAIGFMMVAAYKILKVEIKQYQI